MDQYDSIIIGAGHNGLVCAAYLALNGKSVLVLEASEVPGGLAATREIHPGFKTSIAHTVSHLSPEIIDDLDLPAHGLKFATDPLPTVGLDKGGAHVHVNADGVTGVGDADGESYSKYIGMMNRFAAALRPFWLKAMPRIGSMRIPDLMTFAHMGLKLRGLGKADMREFMRVVSLPTRDLMDEFFENDLLKAVLSWDGLIGSKLAPRSPNSAVLAMLYRMAGGPQGQNGAHSIPVGGTTGVIDALVSAATSAGAEIRTGSPVRKVTINGDNSGLVASGVELADGSTLQAKAVISATDPKRTFFDLVGIENLEIEFTNRIRRLRCDGFVAKLHLALNALPEFTGLTRPEGRMIIAPRMDSIEFAFDDAKYGDCPQGPVIELVIPTLHDATLAPEGQHVLSAHVMYVPKELKGGWSQEKRHEFEHRVIDTIEMYAPKLRDNIVHHELMTPGDLEREYHVTGGHWHHTEFAMDQLLMMRPTHGAAQYSTPIAGLFLCGAGCHPGGGIMGGPGHNAARAVIKAGRAA
jgi:phytoene dehydrogenase-like protein